MSRPPEQVIRSYVEENGDLDDVPIEHLLVSWGFHELTQEARETIGPALSAAGVRVEPPVELVRKHGSVSLSLRADETPPQELTEEAPPPRPRRPVPRPTLRGPKLRRPRQPKLALPGRPEPALEPPLAPEPAPPAEREHGAPPATTPYRRRDRPAPGAILSSLDRPRALVPAGGLAALLSLWVPWVRWEEGTVITVPAERSVDAWNALGAEPVAIVLAVAFGAASLAPLDSVPESWRSFYPWVSSAIALAFGGLAVIVSVVSALSPPESTVYLSATVQAGPFLALAGGLALTAGPGWAGPSETRPRICRRPHRVQHAHDHDGQAGHLPAGPPGRRDLRHGARAAAA